MTLVAGVVSLCRLVYDVWEKPSKVIILRRKSQRRAVTSPNGHIVDRMSLLTFFGLFAVTAMLIFYALETRSHWFILAFAGGCLLGSAYGFLQGAWPFGVVEAIWAVVAFRRWLGKRRQSPPR
ncbi:MAG TPA: hypothetical protein VNJ04_13710, partial [Gemmatimonadaceae bacterium]|nr:hypothetical protein [Gemmatimonadaceae bacterium]